MSDLQFKKAPFWKRFSASLIDFVLWYVLATAVSFLLITTPYGLNIQGHIFITSYSLYYLYHTLCVAMWGKTLGKKLLRIKVVTTSYQNVGFFRALLRETIGKLLSSLFNLGFLWVLISKNRQTWHDKLFGTFVISVDSTGNKIPLEKEESISAASKILFILLLLLSLLPHLFLFTYIFIFRPYQVSGRSMNPNFTDRQYGVFNLYDRSYSRFDVIVFKSSVDPTHDRIGRIVGLPGEKIMVANGNVYVNGELLDESFYKLSTVKTYGGAFLRESMEIDIPQDHFFMMGDNRPYSSDSRETGFIAKKDIIGKFMFCYLNCSTN